MIICILPNPDRADPKRKNANLEVRIMVEGILLEEADLLGTAIREFAMTMGREATLNAFQLDDEVTH